MSRVALFVDLPNFYSRLLKCGIEEPRFLRDYFSDWLDLDMLARSLAESFSGIWVFYSGERLGPSSERLAGKFLIDYIRRINALEGVTARDANIGGEQREPVSYKCDNCQYEGVAEHISEKGVDASLTVHLFDTMVSWDTAFLLSGDADFVPAVASLRRRGKIVIGVGFADAAPALIQECYHYVNIGEVFLREDVFLYSLFKKDGVCQKWLTGEVHHDTRYSPRRPRPFWPPPFPAPGISLQLHGGGAAPALPGLGAGSHHQRSFHRPGSAYRSDHRHALLLALPGAVTSATL